MEEDLKQESSLAMHLAVCRGDTFSLQTLIEAGFDVNRDSEYGAPLHVAVMAEQTEAAQILVGAGADLEVLYNYDMEGQDEPCNPLRLAVHLGCRDIVQLLWKALSARRNPRTYRPGGQADQGGWGQSSLLVIAADDDYPEITMDLLSFSDEWAPDERASALNCAARVWSAGSVRALLQSAHFTDDEMSCFLKSCCSGRPKCFNHFPYRGICTHEDSVRQAQCVEYLLDAYPGADCIRILHRAAQNAYCIETLRFTLHRGVDPNSLDGELKTPLHRAVIRRVMFRVNKDGAFLLLENGADPNIPDVDGMRALHRAVELGGDIEVVKRLLEAGADAEALDSESATPMITAAYSRLYNIDGWRVLQIRILKLLLRAGNGKASIEWEDDRGRSVKKWAKENKIPDQWLELDE
ncbi:ankyrin [Aaosphaeria arxii CBS 175.79]|uniref:Ankyrin n=1 Tax=Aaosphaeria arxii CBS 175.79 TaxID=1450172 RepID=A0A6A5XV71_9PLEO|nr:ankyrin [Aaosphaeria arxii CBS 175.79]KAF2016833.1 ankyrin [Aaosphaeria arxii CBS 175.79]